MARSRKASAESKPRPAYHRISDPPLFVGRKRIEPLRRTLDATNFCGKKGQTADQIGRSLPRSVDRAYCTCALHPHCTPQPVFERSEGTQNI
jgi:hypothetical protein